MELSDLRAPRPVPPKLSGGDRKVQTFLRDLEKIKNSKRPRKQLKRSEDLIFRIVQALRKTDSDHLLYTTCIWTLINIFRLFPEPAKEIMLTAGVPGALHHVIASGLLTGSMRQYTSELCFFLSSNQPYPGADGIPQSGPLKSLPDVPTASRYNTILDDVSVASSDMSSTVPEGHRDPSKHAFVPYRINDQNMRKLEDLFDEGYRRQLNASLPRPEFMSRFGFTGADKRNAHAGTGTGIVGENWQVSDSDDEDEEEHRNFDDGSVNSTISSGSRSLAYSASSGNSMGAATVSMGGSAESGRYSFSSGVSGQGLPIRSTSTHGIGIGMHNRQIGRFAGGALGLLPPTSGPLFAATRDYDSWHQRHGPHENPFFQEATPLSTHYRPTATSHEMSNVTQFRIGGFGLGPAAHRPVHAASAEPTLGADYPKGGKRDRDGFDLASPSMSLTLSQLSDEPVRPGAQIAHVGSSEYDPDAMSSTYPYSSHQSSARYPPQQQQQQQQQYVAKHRAEDRHRRHPHTRALEHSRSLTEGSWPGLPLDGVRTDEYDPVTTVTRAAEQGHGQVRGPAGLGGTGGMFDTRAPLKSIASAQYGDRPSDLLLGPGPSVPSTSLLDVSPTRRALQAGGSPTRQVPSLTGSVHPPRGRGVGASTTLLSPGGRGGAPLQEQSSSAGRSEIDDMLAQLDPLSLSLNAARAAGLGSPLRRRHNTVGGVGEASWVSEEGGAEGFTDYIEEGDEESADDEDGQSQDSATEDGFFDSHMVEAPGSKYNEFLMRKKMRIRAEKLIDHTFTRKLFVKKATTAQAQNLVARMESLLQLMDPQSTGFVTWECFARLILAVAPSHLLRADVMAFMQAQTDNDQNLVDYKEFIISGKVMIIDKQRTGRDNLPVTGWLHRQKLYSGDESTLTWQNHIKWYQSRKSKAVVWLMRRAARSMRYSVLLEEAQRFLLNQRKRAIAVTYLLEVGWTAIKSQDAWKEATRSLLKRTMHARRWAQTVAAAQIWLATLAKGAVQQLKAEDEMAAALDEASVSSLASSSLESVLYAVPKKQQPDYGTLYKLHQYNVMANNFLKQRAARALQHCARQDAIQERLKVYAQRMLLHQLYTESALSWLRMTSERAYNYCMHVDDTLKYLLRRGQHALAYMDRQEAALKWLLNRGKESVEFVASKADALFSLVAQGQRTLAFLNAREDAFAGLTERCRRAVRLVARKKEAISFLGRQPLGWWASMDNIADSQRWLAQRGARAVAHLERRGQTFAQLRHMAGKAATVQRRQNIAHTDLQQFGQEAKIARFAEQCRTLPQYAKRVKEERTRIAQVDKRHGEERAALSKEARWRVELLDAFEWIATSITPAAYQTGKKPLIGRVGFLWLLQQGKLLGTTKDITYELFKSVDPGTACFVPFDNVWPWFQHHALTYEASKLTPQKKELRFTVADILSPELRAQVAVLKRVNHEKIELTSDTDWSAVEVRRRWAGLLESSSSEDEEDGHDEYEAVDDETLFSDPQYMQSADIGRMMRYLTKRRLRREREEREAAYQAQLKAQISASARQAEAARMSVSGNAPPPGKAGSGGAYAVGSVSPGGSSAPSPEKGGKAEPGAPAVAVDGANSTTVDGPRS